MKVLTLMTILAFCTISSFSFGQKANLIISIPDIQDVKSVEFINSFIDTSNYRCQNNEVIIYESMDIISFSSLKKKFIPDTINLFCSSIFNIPDLDIRRYGTKLTSDFVRYIKFIGIENSLDSICLQNGIENFVQAFYFKKIKEIPNLIYFIEDKLDFDDIEIILFEMALNESNNQDVYQKTADIMRNQQKQLIWIHEWDYILNDNFDGVHVNLIPLNIEVSIINSKKRKNKIKNYDLSNSFSRIKEEQLPKKIKLNDFLKIKKHVIASDINYAYLSTKYCFRKDGDISDYSQTKIKI